MPSVRLIAVTKPCITFEDGSVPTPEGLIAYCARVSSPNQENPNYEKLLRYCIKEGHWSIFEQVDMTVEVITSRGIAAQILRHKTLFPQEMSQRYTKALDYESYKARRQDLKNRQNSIDDLPLEVKDWFVDSQSSVWEMSKNLYEEALKKGIAKECARFLLPLNTQTRMYLKGSVRSWIHYLKVRCDKATQLEHREVAFAISDIFKAEFPTIYAAAELGWS
jgi:thymidylate synthase (FAD)